jgi:hypothetical protein
VTVCSSVHILSVYDRLMEVRAHRWVGAEYEVAPFSQLSWMSCLERVAWQPSAEGVGFQDTEVMQLAIACDSLGLSCSCWLLAGSTPLCPSNCLHVLSCSHQAALLKGLGICVVPTTSTLHACAQVPDGRQLPRLCLSGCHRRAHTGRCRQYHQRWKCDRVLQPGCENPAQISPRERVTHAVTPCGPLAPGR